MGKTGRNEMKRVAANFFNGAAVALLTAGFIAPLLSLNMRGWVPAVYNAMSKVRGKDTKPEMTVRRMTHGLGYRSRVISSNFPGDYIQLSAPR